jgi:hypothetical protein
MIPLERAGPTTGYTLGPGTVAPIAAPAITGASNLRKFLFLHIVTTAIIPTKMTSKVGRMHLYLF